MKLYTEEQVRQSFIAGMEFIAVDPLKYEQDANEYMNSLTPIELPSDEEIEKALPDGFPHSDGYDAGKICGFEDGAKWMKEQILGKEDKTFKKKSQWTEVDNMTRRLK